MALTTFTAAQVLTAAQLNAVQANDYNQTVSTKTASYTLVAADKGTRVVMNVASANTVTVNTSLFAAGDTLVIQNIGAGVTTVTAGTATVSSAGPLAIPQNGSGTLYFTSAGVAIFYPSAGPAASSGLTFIASGSVTGQTTLTISNCFSATYANYKLIIANAFASDAGYKLQLQFGTGSADTAADYIYGFSGTVTGSATLAIVGNLGATGTGRKGGLNMEIQSPNLAQPTNAQVVGSIFSSATGLSSGLVSVQKPTTTQYTSIFLSCESPENFTFDYRIYGYANS